MIVKKPNNIPPFIVEFMDQYQTDHGHKFIESQETFLRLITIIRYLTRSPLFFRSSLINQKLSKPGWDKGLLIIGDYGTGKSSILQTLVRLQPSLYRYHTALDVTSEYESLHTSYDKKNFMEKYAKGTRLFDDILTEPVASNFGLKNVFKDILEIRCSNNAKTILACNYDPEHGNEDVNSGLLQFRAKYGGRVYDRLFEMFNIVEFKGKSMRR